MPLNKSQLLALNQTNFPDNTQQLITPELLRDFNDDMIASMQLTQSMDNYANLSTANIFYGGNQSIEKEYKLFTNGVYWNNNTAGYNNLEIINSITGNIDIAALGGGVRIVSSSLNITNGTFTASLAEGFTYVGNGSGRTSLVSTSSFGSTINTGSFVSTSSFNAYTQSNDQRVSSLETNSASVNISISNLNTATASLFASVNSLNSFTQSQNTLNGQFATTGSNTFRGNQIISGSSDPYTLDVNGLFNLTRKGSNPNVGIEIRSSNSTIEPAYINFHSGETWQLSSGIGNIRKFQLLLSSSPIWTVGHTGSFDFYRDVNITGSLTASLQEGYVLVGNSNNRTVLVATSSFGGATNTGSFMTTGSVSGNTLTFTKGDATTFSLTVATGSGGSTIDTGSFATTASFNAYTQSTNIRLDNLESTSASVNISISNLNSTTSSFATSITNLNSATASLFTSASLALVTASVNLNTITFTKGDTSTFNIVVNTGSAVTTDITSLNSFTASQETKDTTLASVTSSLNTATASLFTSASLALVTASFSGNTLTFTKGDTSTFGVVIPDVSGSSINTGSFATTGSNTFSGSQFITGGVQIKEYIQTGPEQLSLETEYAIKTNGALKGNGFVLSGSQATEALNIYYPGTRWQHAGSVVFTNQVNYPVSGAAYEGSGSIDIIAYGGGTLSISGSQLTLSDVQFIPFSASLNTRIQQLMTTGSASGNVLTFSKGDGSTFDLTVATGSGGGGSTFTNPSVESISGSLLLTANTFTSGAASIANLTSSAANFVNLVFKNNSNTADTIISGSNNIFTNPQTPTTGYKRYIGGSNNLHLNNTSGIAVQITASAASVSGNRPTMNNNIFQGVGPFNINQAVNTGTHDYSQNYYNGGGTTTINALGFTGSLSFNNNFSINATATINAASASLTEIASGLSGSGTLTIQANASFGGTMTNTSPRLPGFAGQSMNNNVIAGGAITVTNISSSGAVNSNNNFANSALSYTNAGAAGLGVHTGTGAITNNYGGGTIIASGSAVAFNFNTTSGNNLTLTNRAFSGSLGVGQFSVIRNIFYGQSGTLLITGSVDGTGNTTGAFTDNAVIGKNNTIFSNQSGAGVHNSFISNVVGGEQLIISASNSFNSTIGGGAYFGRYNANDGVRNKTGQTVFSVGTGTSTARKTGLLIDSGSNMFVEGTLNVSGSTAFTGSVKVASTFQLQLPTGSNQQAGTAVLDGANPGEVIVSNSLVTANSIIMVSKQTLAHPNGYVAVSAKSAGSFTITSNHNGDADTVGWFIINNS